MACDKIENIDGALNRTEKEKEKGGFAVIYCSADRPSSRDFAVANWFSSLASLVFLIALPMAGCGSDSNPMSEDSATDSEESSSGDTIAPSMLTGPDFTPSDNADAPLVGTLDLSTDEPTTVSVKLSDSTHSWTESYNDLDIEHSLPLVWLHPDETHDIVVTVTDAAGNSTEAEDTISFATDPLPSDFPPLVQTVYDGDLMEPGFTLFAVNYSESEGIYIVVVDRFGEVAWFLNWTQSGMHDLRRLANGNLLFTGVSRIFEVNVFGEIVASWNTIGSHGAGGWVDVNFDEAHHEIYKMPSGNLLTLSVHDREVANYPLSDSDPGAGTATQTIQEDIVEEFTTDGEIVREHFLGDIIDPTRIGYNSVGGSNDWAHANAVIYDESDDSYIVSARHQDAVFKFDRDTGELLWIIGTHGGWNPPYDQYLLTPTNFSEWIWHQHAPMITPDGNIMIFDNGNFRARPFDAKLSATDNFSRAVEFSIDLDNRKITRVWEYGTSETASEILFAPFIGDADVLPETGNVLITFGGIIRDPVTGEPSESISTGKRNARIVEVTKTSPGTKVMEIAVGTEAFDDGVNASVYRAERISTLIPLQEN